MLNSEKIRDCIKQSPYNFIDIATALDISQRTLYRKLICDDLNVRELNVLLKILNVDITEFEKE